jgi:hypothetical protein
MQRRWQAIAWGIAVIAGAVAVTALVMGIGTWSDFATLMRQVSDPVSTPHNFTPGAIAYQLGVPAEVASAVQLGVMVLVVLVVIVAGLRAAPLPGFLVAVVASQLLSPILWDHYSMLLLLPVRTCSIATLVAALVPLALSARRGITPPSPTRSARGDAVAPLPCATRGRLHLPAPGRCDDQRSGGARPHSSERRTDAALLWQGRLLSHCANLWSIGWRRPASGRQGALRRRAQPSAEPGHNRRSSIGTR